MPRAPKVFFHDETYGITTATEEGLPFPPNPLINLIIESCLARAQKLYPVKINSYDVSTNHVHLVITAIDPADIPRFMERFKTESSHAINRLVGRKKKTIWCEGYDSPALLTPEDVVRTIVYGFINPAKDNLADSIGAYPGLSSWRYRDGATAVREVPWIRRSSISKLARTDMTMEEVTQIAESYRNASTEKLELTITPNAWMRKFGITDPEEERKYTEDIKARVEAREKEYREERQSLNIPVMKATTLALRPIDTPFTPKRSNEIRRTCRSTDETLLHERLALVRDLTAQARDVRRRWREGNTSARYPLGLFPPSMPRLGENFFSRG
jgi:REP element-mobilizing transposase RayT